MGCEFKTQVKLDYIQDFEMMFERMKIDRPREAAVYYVTLIIDCPKEFSDFLKIAEEFANITRRPLETGRNSLLKNGLIAKVLFSNDNNENFGRESYLPAHPKALWEDIKLDLKKVIAEDTYRIIENRISEYSNYYTQNFEKYGVKLKRNGNVTIQYSGKWVLYNVLSNCLANNEDLKIQVGGERFFDDPFLKYFKKLLDLDTKVQLIIDNTSKMDIINQLKETYGANLEIRHFSEDVAGTMRNFVFGKEIAINGIKILPETSHEPSYIGTAYVDLQDIEQLSGKFNSLWDIAKPLKKEQK